MFVLTLAAISHLHLRAVNLQLLTGDCGDGSKPGKRTRQGLLPEWLTPSGAGNNHFLCGVCCLLDHPYLTCFLSQPTAAIAIPCLLPFLLPRPFSFALPTGDLFKWRFWVT